MKIPKKTAIIVGNGKSREGQSLIELSKKGIVFGCNALYRDYAGKWPWYDIPDFLVCIDKKIYNEIKQSEWPEDKIIYPPLDEQFEPLEMHRYTPRPRSNAGMVAMIEAIKRGYNHLICIGFDFLLVDDVSVTDNMYEGTNAYGPETKASLADSRNRMNFLSYLLEKHIDITFEFVYPKTAKIYQPLSNNFIASNYEGITNEHFCSVERSS